MIREVREQVAHINRVLKVKNLRLESWLVLLALEEVSLSQHALRRFNDINKVAMTRALSELCEHGLVNRYRSDRGRRRNMVELTEKGSRMLAVTKSSVLNLVEEFASLATRAPIQ